MKKNGIKTFLAVILVLTILSINSLSLISTAYGGNIGNWDGCKVYIRNVKSGKYIANPGNILIDEGWGVDIYEWCGSPEFIWYIKNEHNGYYTIRSATDTQYMLCVQNDSSTTDSLLEFKYVPQGNTLPDSVLFKFEGNNVGVAYLVSKAASTTSKKRVVTCQYGSTDEETPIGISTKIDSYDASSHQMWVFEDIERSIQLIDWTLVDSLGHCDWTGDTEYSSYLSNALSAWNQYADKNIFRADTWYTILDLQIRDLPTDPEAENAAARATARTYADDEKNGEKAGSIEFYKDEMDKRSSDLSRQKTVMHELGHALGLDENRTSEANEKLGNVMQQGNLAYGTQISLDDKASLKESAKTYKF